MQLDEATALIRRGVEPLQTPATWADLGCGDGLFTHALAQLLPAGSVIHAIDKAAVRLHNFTNTEAVTLLRKQQDFETAFDAVPPLNGVLMANALHFVKDKNRFIKNWQRALLSHGVFLIVEYDTATANPWVPFPVSFHSLVLLFSQHGYTSVEKIGVAPSRYQRGGMYAALIAA